MPRTYITILLGVLVASLVAWRLGGVRGVGTAGGFLFGASLGVLAAHWQAHVARTRPAAVMQASLLGFLIVLFGVMISGLSLRFLDQAGALADWRAFLISYAAAGLIAIIAGAADTMYVLKEGSSL